MGDLCWESSGSGRGKRYRVTLATDERDRMTSRGKADARKLVRARVLLQAGASEGGPGWSDGAISEALRVSVRTIERVRQRFVEDGLQAALLRRPGPRVYARKLDGSQEARLVALACSDPPAGKKRRTLRLLRNGGAVCARPSGWSPRKSCPACATRRCARCWGKNTLKPHLRQMRCTPPKRSAEFVCRVEPAQTTKAASQGSPDMEGVLDVRCRPAPSRGVPGRVEHATGR